MFLEKIDELDKPMEKLTEKMEKKEKQNRNQKVNNYIHMCK